ncbi:MAG: hypothetical protein J7K15_01575, partial [Deltaproteobacteria bacterium]|nr:hypothetical protein [Deltaproteobacteria bacterium]
LSRYISLGIYLWFFSTERPASPAPKANDDLARAAFYTDYAKVKNGLALGVRVNAIVIMYFFNFLFPPFF